MMERTFRIESKIRNKESVPPSTAGKDIAEIIV